MSVNIYQHLPKRLHFWLIFTLIFFLIMSAVTLPGSPSLAATTMVSADFSTNNGAPSHSGAGFLYGLSQDGSGPVDSLLQPLQITLMRGGGASIGAGWIADGYTAGPSYQARITSALNQARRVTTGSYHATYDLLVSDLYGLGGLPVPDPNVKFPCDNGDCSNYINFIDRVLADVNAAGVFVSFDIQNEPDGTSFWQRGVNSTQYFQMWDTAVREIRRLKPGAWIIGPSYSGWNP